MDNTEQVHMVNRLAAYLLQKRGKRKIIWKKRWFELMGTELKSYKSDKASVLKSTVDLKMSRGLRQINEIKLKSKHFPEGVSNFMFGLAMPKKVILLCALESQSYQEWTSELHRTIAECNKDAFQETIMKFMPTPKDEGVIMFDEDYYCSDEDSSSSDDGEEIAFNATNQNAMLDLEKIKKIEKQQQKGYNSQTGSISYENIRGGTPTNLNKTNQWTRSAMSLNSDAVQFQQVSAGTTTPVGKRSLNFIKSGYATMSRNDRNKYRAPRPVMVECVSPLQSMKKTDLDIKRVGSPLKDLAGGLIRRPSSRQSNSQQENTNLFTVKRSESSNAIYSRNRPVTSQDTSKSRRVDENEKRVESLRDECRSEVEGFKKSASRLLDKEVEVEHDFLQLIDDTSLYQKGAQRLGGIKQNVHSILINLYKALFAVAEQGYVRRLAKSVIGKFQFTLYKIPLNTEILDKPASSLMVQNKKGKELRRDEVLENCTIHYYVQLQIEHADCGQRNIDILSVLQCEAFWENLLKGRESKFCLIIENSIQSWQENLARTLGRRIGIYLDIVEILWNVEREDLRHQTAELLGNNNCQKSLGTIVSILKQLAENELTKAFLFKKLRFIELCSLATDATTNKLIEWSAEGGLIVSAKWDKFISIQYVDVYGCVLKEATRHKNKNKNKNINVNINNNAQHTV